MPCRNTAYLYFTQKQSTFNSQAIILHVKKTLSTQNWHAAQSNKPCSRCKLQHVLQTRLRVIRVLLCVVDKCVTLYVIFSRKKASCVGLDIRLRAVALLM